MVRDGNVITGGGVTAGIDFAFTVAAEVAGPEAAQSIQLALEYCPAPPFTAGNTQSAPGSVVAAVQPVYDARLAVFRGELEKAMMRH